MSASLIGRLRSSAFRLSTTAASASLAGSCFSSDSAQGPSSMGSEDKVEQSLGRPCPMTGPSGHANSPHPSSREGRHPHLFQRDIEKIVNAIFDEMVEALRRGDRVELRGFGAFSAKLRGARQGRNPKTGAAVTVGKKAIPYFKTGKDMRARLNRETVP